MILNNKFMKHTIILTIIIIIFDSFPMFSNDGKKIVFSSNRNNNGTKNTNLFTADWVE